ncbi:MAG TPA: plastocyanin/azurin family copper-binding protein [Tepidisphaeraceae bacterium]|jgi:azurin
MKKPWHPLVLASLLVAVPAAPFCAAQPQDAAPQVFLDRSPQIVAYQLKRLTNAQLLAVERKTTDAKYKPVYEAILTRKGIDKKFRDESVNALAQLNKSDPVVELLSAIGKADPEDKSTPRELIGLLMAQKPAAIAKQREKIQAMATESQTDLVKQAAYAALAVADQKPDTVWDFASKNDQGLPALLSGVALINDGKLRSTFYDRVNPLVPKATDDATQVAAIDVVGMMPGHEADVFKELATLIRGTPGAVRDAAVRSIRRIPADKWPQDQIEPLAKDIVKLVKDTPADQRTTPQAAQAVQLGNDLAGELADEQGLPIRKSLRDLGVRVVVLRTLREQMQYDTRYFAVQAGKPVQVILQNDDAMPHNLVITAPGALQEIAVAAGQMPPPDDANSKTAYIPQSPKVLQALSMVQPGESETLNFTAPTQPGQYDYVCTFPGHWVRMYGVMLVVPDLDAWEKTPSAPSDPILKKPYDSAKNEATGAMPGMEH